MTADLRERAICDHCQTYVPHGLHHRPDEPGSSETTYTSLCAKCVVEYDNDPTAQADNRMHDALKFEDDF